MRPPSIRYFGSGYPVPAKSEAEFHRDASRWSLCSHCSSRPCSWTCPKVLTGASPCPPRTPLTSEPLSVQAEVARKRAELGLSRTLRSESLPED